MNPFFNHTKDFVPFVMEVRVTNNNLKIFLEN